MFRRSQLAVGRLRPLFTASHEPFKPASEPTSSLSAEPSDLGLFSSQQERPSAENKSGCASLLPAEQPSLKRSHLFPFNSCRKSSSCSPQAQLRCHHVLSQTDGRTDRRTDSSVTFSDIQFETQRHQNRFFFPSAPPHTHTLHSV